MKIGVFRLHETPFFIVSHTVRPGSSIPTQTNERGMIRVNNLAVADNAVFGDEPMRFFMGTENEAEAQKLRERLEEMKKNGEN